MTKMTKIKIKVAKSETRIDAIPMRQLFTGHIGSNDDWIFKKIEMNDSHLPVIISLSSDGTYGHYWDDPPVKEYNPIEFEKV